MTDPSPTPPKVLVAWHDEGPEHRAWVEAFATRLRADGIDATLDLWDARPGDQFPHLMETWIRESAFVVHVCTPTYAGRFDRRTGGVGYEAHLASAEALVQGNWQKFVPVVRHGDERTAKPSFLLGSRHLDLTGDPHSEDAYRELVETLLGRRPVKPPLGEPMSTIRGGIANPPRAATLHNLPPQTLDFIGRDDELARIHALVASDKAVAISQPTSVSGLGGIGKTQLALRYALLHADEFDAVLWVDAAGEDITPAFADLDEVLRLTRAPDVRVVDRAKVVREALEVGGPKLLVLDNVDHFKAVKPHIPRWGPTRVLMTTRLLNLPGTRTVCVHPSTPCGPSPRSTPCRRRVGTSSPVRLSSSTAASSRRWSPH